jgi:penicillin-binding protein 1A
LNKRKKSWFTIRNLFLYSIGGLFAFCFLFLSLIWFGLFGPVPGTEELHNIQQQEASRILSADGEQIGTYHLQNRTTVSLDEISPVMLDALLAIEDIRFYNHNGIDKRALARVFVRTILLRQNAGGGSTITQQLAKNLYPREYKTGIFIVTDKVREMIIAHRIEGIYSKDEILELYLNTISFGEDTFGIEMASFRFFSKSPSELTLNEAAILAGLLQATTFYNPHRNPERSAVRRNIVIRQMARYGMISEELAESTLDEPLEVLYNRNNLSDGIAPYFREHLRGELISIFTNRPALDGRRYNLYTDGLMIHTTLDSRIQRAAEKAVASRMQELQAIFNRELEKQPVFGMEDPDVMRAWRQSDKYRYLRNQRLSEEELDDILHEPVPTLLFSWDGYEEKTISPYNELRYYLSFLNAGLIAMNPNSGNVLAWVGGIEHRHFQFDQVKASRQPGSAFKPILYAAALEAGRSPCDYQRNLLATYTNFNDWTPRNDKDEYGGRYSLQAALAQSINTVAVQLAIDTGLPSIQKTATKMGIHSHIPEAPSIALGTANISLIELTSAYTAFLNKGVSVKPQIVTRIYNADGEMIYDFSGSVTYQTANNRNPLSNASEFLKASVLPEVTGISTETAAAMVKMLRKAVDEGTGQTLRSRYGITHALAGKTGTTQQFTDGWFVGFTPEIVFGTRVGGWNNRVRFREFPAYASQTALPIAGEFLSLMSENENLPGQPINFRSDQVDSPYSTTCSDYHDDRFRDRVKDFFTGRSSDDPVKIDLEEKEEKSGNIFKRIGRRLGLN